MTDKSERDRQLNQWAARELERLDAEERARQAQREADLQAWNAEVNPNDVAWNYPPLGWATWARERRVRFLSEQKTERAAKDAARDFPLGVPPEWAAWTPEQRVRYRQALEHQAHAVAADQKSVAQWEARDVAYWASVRRLRNILVLVFVLGMVLLFLGKDIIRFLWNLVRP